MTFSRSYARSSSVLESFFMVFYRLIVFIALWSIYIFYRMSSDLLVQKYAIAFSRRTETSAISDKKRDEEPPTSTEDIYRVRDENVVVLLQKDAYKLRTSYEQAWIPGESILVKCAVHTGQMCRLVLTFDQYAFNF